MADLEYCMDCKYFELMDAKTKIEKLERAIDLIEEGKSLIADAENLAEECGVDTGGVICDCDDAIAECNEALDKIIENGDLPNHSCRGVSGPNVKTIDEEEADRLLTGAALEGVRVWHDREIRGNQIIIPVLEFGGDADA